MPPRDLKRAGYLTLAPAMLAAAVLLAPRLATAHFMITAPSKPPQAATVQSWMSQDSVGGPQKNGPCAATPNTSLGDSMGTPVANALTVVDPGQKVTIPVTITIAHTGWFRIALAQGASSTQTLTTLPDPSASNSCAPTIMSNPVWSPTQPILADGLPSGSTSKTNQTGTKTFQVTIPSNASCSMTQPCSLQVIMVMTDHQPGDCYYHHCADVAVSSGGTDGGSSSGAGGSTPGGGSGGHASGGGGSPASGTGGSGTGGSATGGSGTGGLSATGGSGEGGSTGSGGGSGGSSVSGTGGGSSATGGQSGGTTSGTGGSSSTGSGSSGSSGGCTVAGHGGASWLFGAFGALALVLSRRRRR